MTDIDPRVQAVTFALADPESNLPLFQRMCVLGVDMTPFAEIAVKALNKYDEEHEDDQIITTTIDPDAFTDGPLRPRWMP